MSQDPEDKLHDEYIRFCEEVEEDSIQKNFVFQKISDFNKRIEALEDKAGIKRDGVKPKKKILKLSWK